ncbi:MAG TPA: hypothetical protein VFG83_10615 [Kofleriaceae bacterium]|nr:hypothetical protein [Kofleriaceae bacterium]
MPVFRPLIVAAVTAATLSFGPQLAFAQSTPAQRAEALNNEGKQLFTGSKDYAGAAAKFREAIVLDPQPKYYVNLCFSLHLVGQNREALSNCAIAEKNGDEEVVAKARKLSAVIRQRMAETGDAGQANPGQTGNGSGSGQTGNGTGNGTGQTGNDTGNGTGQTGNGTGTGQPAGQVNGGTTAPGYYSPYLQAPTAPGDYMWSLGGELGLFRNLSIGNEEAYNNGGPELRLYANFMLGDTLGAQGYFDYGNLQGMGGTDPLQVVDLGGGLFTHLKLSERFYVTPLVGLHLGLMQPDPDESTALVAIGGRAEVGIDWLLGTRGEHVIHIKPVAFNFYGAAQDADPLDAGAYGLDEPGTAYTFTVGYSYRFSTPFGSSPLITLE